MTTRKNAAAGATAPPIASPHWPGLRHADLIERSLRRLTPARRDVVLDALAQAIDRYVAATAQRIGSACIDLDEELDSVLRSLGPTAGANATFEAAV
jgi:hypothetical protein